MQELATDHQVSIITPRKVHHLLKKGESTYGKEKCKVYRPLYLSVSNREIGWINTGNLSSYCFERAVHGALKKLGEKPDLIYAHFLSNALPVISFAQHHKIPLVVASGESTYTSWRKTSKAVQLALRNVVRHVICVSNENQQQLIKLGFDPGKMSVIPNAVNYKLFRPLNKEDCKQQLGLALEKFTVGFVGHFIHRKGPNRIIEAIESMGDSDVQLVCVGGKGNLKPNGFTKVVGPVANSQLPEIYNAFDVFVLPTLREGHCNVIEEAKACGIPIISSKGTSVEEQVDESIGFLVDPLNIGEIADAIRKIKNSPSLREQMIGNLVEKRGRYSLKERAKRINDIFLRVV
jgi:teichuronic acid biosynthesis glycosyltransferase TuaC